jgi:hypothetical protein
MAEIGKRFFKLVNNEVVFGDCETIEKEGGGVEILIKKPFTVVNGKIMPYMSNVMMASPAAIQIHPMNILWTVPLDEFEEVYNVYSEATSGIILNPKEKILV